MIWPLCHQQLQQRRVLSAEKLSKIKSWLLDEWPECLLYYGTVPFQALNVLVSDSHNSEESEKVSELKSVSGSSKLPYGTLASGTEGIKEAISSFDDACVFAFLVEVYAPHP